MLLQTTKFNIIKNVKDFPLYSVDIYGYCRSLVRNAYLSYSRTKDGSGKFGDLHPNSIKIVGYDNNGNKVIEFGSISLARKAGYNLDFYRRKSDGVSVKCKGIIFKKEQYVR